MGISIWKEMIPLDAKVISNEAMFPGLVRLKISARLDARGGQFCMLRAHDCAALLPRPYAIYDEDAEGTTFIIQDVGVGSGAMTRLLAGEEVEVNGPLGHPFPTCGGRVALVGGGSGIAPLHLAAKRLASSGADVDVYLGFADGPILVDDFKAAGTNVTIDVGGVITDKIDPSRYSCVMACGPEAMERALYDKCDAVGVKLYVSIESKMACGIGVCLGCSVKIGGAKRRICKDGPVFDASEVFC